LGGGSGSRSHTSEREKKGLSPRYAKKREGKREFKKKKKKSSRSKKKARQPPCPANKRKKALVTDEQAWQKKPQKRGRKAEKCVDQRGSVAQKGRSVGALVLKKKKRQDLRGAAVSGRGKGG